jgi:NitT/TauT family transport system permease protein
MPALTGLVLLAAWQLGAKDGPGGLAAPAEVATLLWTHFGVLLEHAVPTTTEAVLSLLLAAGIGIALATAISGSTHVRNALYPNLVLLQLVPKIALAPLFIVWLGTGAESRLAFALFLAFFPVTVAAVTGFVVTDATAVRLCRALSASNWQIFALVRFPFALPYIFSGLKIASTMAMIGVIVGEFVTAQTGLGYMVLFSASNMDTSLMIAAMLLMCAIGVALYGAVVALEWLVNRRYGSPTA